MRALIDKLAVLKRMKNESFAFRHMTHLENDPPNLGIPHYMETWRPARACRWIRVKRTWDRGGLRAEKGILPPPERVHGVWGSDVQGAFTSRFGGGVGV